MEREENDEKMNKSILVTGGYGFIGSNFILNFLDSNSDTTIVNLDLLTYAADKNNLEDLKENPNYVFVHGNILDESLVKNLFDKYKFNGLINFAAESHVDNSISSPKNFVETNIMGVFNLLEIVRANPTCRFIQVSTDEVYGSLDNAKDLFTEQTCYAPNSPYSSSKASADMLVRSYFHTYGLDVLITNCSNNYGPRQHKEKLIPKIIFNAINGKEIPIYGDGLNVRDWLFVEDHVIAIEAVYKRGLSGESYNIGGNNEYTNNQIVNIVCQILDRLKPKTDSTSYKTQIKYVQDRLGHDKRYGIDSTKIRKKLNWVPYESFSSGIEKTVEWYLKKYS